MDVTVQAEIYDICETELQTVGEISPLEGYSSGDPNIYTRRAVRRSQLETYLAWDLGDDEFKNQAPDYTIVYRKITTDEKIARKSSTNKWVILAVVHNRDLWRLRRNSYLFEQVYDS